MPRNCAVIIGINDYDEISPLKYSKSDAEKVRDFFIQDLGVKDADLYFFTDDSPRNAQARKTQPTYGTLKSFLLDRFVDPFLSIGDTLWFYFSGHGMPYEGRDYLLPSDSNPRTVPDLAIPVSYVTERLRRSGSDNVVLLIDACRSYGTKNEGKGISEEKQQGVIAFFSCISSQVSYEIDEIGQGAFTNVLLEALRIQGEVNCATVERFANYLKFWLPSLTQKYKNYQQTPYIAIEPVTKLHYILLPKFANFTDISLLKVDALNAEAEGDFGLAFQLWMRVNVAANGTDIDAIKALSRIASKSSNSSSNPKAQEVYITQNSQVSQSLLQDSPKDEGKKLNEAKIILVGHGGVGKTSLIKQLIDRDFKSDENKTEGIDIRHWIVKTREESIRLRIWDFGGQEIMHATHQFFLTERSLYLLVLNARKDEGNNDIEYWLKIIESFGKDSPVLVISNKSDEHALKLNRRHLQDKYPNIQDFFFTSCKTGEGIDLLRTAIIQQIATMDHVFNIFPLQWFRVKEIIEKIDNDYIAYSEYENLCSTEGVIGSQERKSLIRLLHLLGIVLNFAEDTRLKDTSVLNPEWVTGGVYRILNDNKLSTKDKGMLNWQDLTRILTPKNKGDRNCYQETRDRQFILDMMQKFELCFPLDSNSQKPIYLIPELLAEEEPDTGNWGNTINLEYHYKILFSSVISRFIVKMHHRISKHTYWRTGVILAFPEGNRAYIKADLTDAKIFIRIDGNSNTRRSSLAAIRNTFESIHHSISALEVDERVPLPDNPKVSISYKHLLKLETKGETNYFPEGSDRDYNIRELLDGISSIEDRRLRHEKEDRRGDTYIFEGQTGQVVIGELKTKGKNTGLQNNDLIQKAVPETSPKNHAKDETKPMKTILMLAANPQNSVSLCLQQEERDIKERLRLAGYGTEPIKTAVAVRPRDIQQAMLDFKPQIIHFSGHGADEDGLVFEDIDGQFKLIGGEDLADLFDLFSDRIECVVLNACYSRTQAEAIRQKIQYVIGMNQAIQDRSAIEFAVGFYAAIGAGESYEFAFKLGCNAIRLAGIKEYTTPQLLKK